MKTGNILSFLLVIAVAAAGGLIGNRLKLPAGAMLGSMAAVITLQLISAQSPLPAGLQVVLQLTSGTMIGSRVSRDDALGLKRLAIPALIMIVCMFIINVAIGTTMYRFSYLDIVTALFASAPGGMMDMAIVSAELGANPAYVAILQLSRLMFIFTCMIPFYRKIITKLKAAPTPEAASLVAEKTEPPEDPAAEKPELPELPLDPTPRKEYRWLRRAIVTFICGYAGGLILWRLGIPAGAIIGAMLGSSICHIVTGNALFPPKVRLPLQIFAGAFIGMRMDRESILAMHNLLIPALILFVGVIFITFVTAFIMKKLSGLDMTTCLLASTPGGLSEMAILADNMGLDTPKIAVLQVARLMSVIIFFPTMLTLVLRVIG